MAGPPDHQDPAAAVAPTTESTNTKAGPTSPARSDKSSDSEGKPVRDKLKETRIDAQTTQDSASTADKAMHDAPNGSAAVGDQSASGSDSERGRLRRKRSREDFEKDNEVDKQPEKKQEHEKGERHHTRKRSRDIKDIESGPPIKNATNSVSRIEETDVDEQMTSPSKATSKNSTSHADTSPKNKRTRDQAETAEHQTIENGEANGKSTSDAESERDPKRPRDEDTESSDAKTETKSKIPPGSGFANTSSASPFATMAAKPLSPKPANAAESLPQTSSEKFQASGFGSFASSAASPFGGLKSPGSSSPFGAAAGGTKLSSFAGSKSSSESTGSGFGGLGNSTKSAFGNGTFGSALGGGFGSLAGSKPGLSSFATPADLTIKGLKSKPSAFGTPADQDKSDDSNDSDGGDDDDNDKDGNDEERKSSQPLLSQQPHETGEEGENTIWTGRAKLYMMAGEGTNKAWKERGVGTFKLNITIDEPRKARFVLRADGTHRLLLNAAVNKELKFGDSSGDKPKDGRLLFNSPTASGELEMYLMRLKSERAVELWEEVNKVKDNEL